MGQGPHRLWQLDPPLQVRQEAIFLLSFPHSRIYTTGTDLRSRQPVAALQVRTPTGLWKYVRPHPASITVNIADVLQFLTNGFLKSSIHRVVAPPPDQAHLDRHGVLYFVRPEDDTELIPIRESPVLNRLGYDVALDEATVGLTAGEWVKARVAKNVSRVGREEESIIKGVKTRYYD